MSCSEPAGTFDPPPDYRLRGMQQDALCRSIALIGPPRFVIPQTRASAVARVDRSFSSALHASWMTPKPHGKAATCGIVWKSILNLELSRVSRAGRAVSPSSTRTCRRRGCVSCHSTSHSTSRNSPQLWCACGCGTGHLDWLWLTWLCVSGCPSRIRRRSTVALALGVRA